MTPKRAFQQQRQNAKTRGIPFEMTFDEWWGIWKDWFHMRGTGTNGLCMARENDSGPYAVGNVYLTTNLGNALDVDPGKRYRNGTVLSDDERIARQQKRERWGKAKQSDFKSHISFKTHCNPDKFVPE